MRLKLLVGLSIAAGLSSPGCADTDFFIPNQFLEEVTDNRTSIEGTFCAEGADALNSFLKIMFIIDRSNSMDVTDPNAQRITAAQDVVLRFVEDSGSLELRDGVEFAILSFFGNVVVHTRDDRGLPGFTDDGALALGSLSQLAQVGANTNYTGALAEALILLDRDMALLDEEARARTEYQIIFLSDGMPFPDNCRGEGNSGSAAVEGVRRLAGLATLYNTEVVFNTAFASDPGMFLPSSDVDDQCEELDPFELNFNDSLGQETRALLDNMAANGNGQFQQFANGDAINFLSFEFAESRRIFALSNFIASNINARADVDQMTADSDGDGLTDEEEVVLGTSPVREDSDLDGYSDLIEFRFRLSGFDPLDPTDANCDERGRMDTDGDGLRDCEEQFLGTQRRRLDTDADGIPDLIEVIFGGDPNSATPVQDRQSDSDADGGSNADEMRWHTDPNNDDVAFRSQIAYEYDQEELPLTDGEACYDFEVSNVRLASTEAQNTLEDPEGLGRGPGWNRTLLYFAQTPYDDPLGDPIYRVACVESRFLRDPDIKVPASGRFDIPERRPGDTYEATGVLRPNNQVCQASVNQDCGLNTYWCRFENDGSCNCFRPPATIEEAEASPDGIALGACPSCSNGADDDGDGLTDFPFDPDCFDTLDDDEATGGQDCTDGIDNDGNGLVDWPDDPGCESGYDSTEQSPAVLPECADGLDNDEDGAIDFPNDGGCDFAADTLEETNAVRPVPACDDGIDNDGDMLIDELDPGCFGFSDAERNNDVDESGPQTCFYCENFTDIRPGQCDITAGYCRPRSGLVEVSGGDPVACTNREDCRGALCIDGQCLPCLDDNDCDEDDGAGGVIPGVCDETRGWCLSAPERSSPLLCTDDSQCAAAGRGVCDVERGRCTPDPYYACRNSRECRGDEVCSEETGFCLSPIFETRPCDDELLCETGACDEGLGWCLPDQEEIQCQSDEQCPFGTCSSRGFCDQASFVSPLRFDPDKDCLRAR